MCVGGWFVPFHVLLLVVIVACLFAGLVALQWRCRVRFHRTRATVVQLQSWWRCMYNVHAFMGTKFAVRRIERAVYANLRSKVLAAWCQELHSCCTWGDIGTSWFERGSGRFYGLAWGFIPVMRDTVLEHVVASSR